MGEGYIIQAQNSSGEEARRLFLHYLVDFAQFRMHDSGSKIRGRGGAVRSRNCLPCVDWSISFSSSHRSTRFLHSQRLKVV